MGYILQMDHFCFSKAGLSLRTTLREGGWITGQHMNNICQNRIYDTVVENLRNQLEERVGIISWIVFGLIAGVIAKLLMPGRDPGGCIVTTLLGIIGAFVGGFLYQIFTGKTYIAQFNIPSLIVAVIGAIILLLIYRLLTGRRI